MKQKKLLHKLFTDICTEHNEFAKKSNSSLAYMWHLHNKGVKYTLGPLLAELNLLCIMDIISYEEKQNLIKMLKSEDDDNIYLAVTSISYFRKSRLKKYGEFNSENAVYNKITDEYHNSGVITFDVLQEFNKYIYDNIQREPS